MSRDNKTFNLREGSFPIKMELSFDDTDLSQIGNIKESISAKIEISSISKDIFHFEGSIRSIFIDQCQTCLKETEVVLDLLSNLVIKDKKEMMEDGSSQDQTHYQDLEHFNIKQLIEEEISLNYPNIVKCIDECVKKESQIKEEKNLPFKKIRDLID
tara:strand:- start:471 stop:941 length:471 start_codon:yes stop_codon:yes gene_type:complete